MNISDKEKAQLAKVREFYESTYHKHAKPNSKISRHNLNLIEKINIKKNQRILDIGCGQGDWLFAVTQKGVIASGVDLSSKAIKVCQTLMPDREFHASAAEILPFDSDTFDYVSCLGSLEHFIKPKQAIQEMVRVAKTNAKFLILVPNSDFLTRKLGFYKGTYQTDAKEEVLSLNQWNDLFESAGIEVIERWKDLHVLSWSWIMQGKWYHWPIRAIQAIALTIWPLRWQYQVYFLCTKKQN